MSSLGKFPYEEAGEVIYLQDMKGENHKINPKSEVELYRRFPWLQFKNGQLRKKYIYLGRQTQKSHPFYIRFDLSEELQDSIPDLCSQINEGVKEVVQSIVNPLSLQQNDKLKEKIVKMHTNSSFFTLFPANSFSVHHGFLLTGIAKPSIRANEVYDSLFLEVLRSKEKVGQQINGRKGVFNMKKLSWDYKFHSYEYFMFMSRAYSVIYARLMEEKVLMDQIDDFTSEQLFNFNQAKTMKYWDKYCKQKEQKDIQYFQYFSTLFKKYHQTILTLKPDQQKHPRKYTLMLNQKQHHLYEFDFRQYFLQQFKGKDLSAQSLQRMVNHNHQRNNQIINTFPFKTTKDRVSLLKKLINDNKSVYHRIKLLPVTQTQSVNLSIQQEANFIILLMRDEEFNVGNSCCLKEVIDRMISKQQELVAVPTTQMETLKIQKESIFYNIYRYQEWGKQYELFNHFSFDPAHLTYEEDGIILPSFEHAMLSMLGLYHLPFTLEQQLLLCTPNPEINIYEQLQQLVKEYELKSKSEDTLKNFLRSLSDEQDGIVFELSQLQQQFNIQKEELEQCDNLSPNAQGLRLKMKILEMSMMDFQSNRTRCLYSQTNNEPFNAFTPTHYKQLHQYLIILLQQTNIIPNISCTIKGVQLQQLLSPANKKQLSANLVRIQSIKALFQNNLSQYKKYTRYNKHRSYFRQLEQKAFREVIRDLYQDFQNTHHLSKGLLQMLRVMLKSFIALQFLETRIVYSKLHDEGEQASKLLASEYLQSLQVFRKTVESISKQEKKDSSRSDLSDPRWKAMNQSYYRQLKLSVSNILKEFIHCKEILKLGPLNSEETNKRMVKQDLVGLQKKIDLIKQSNLVVFCSVYKDLVILQDSSFENMALLYKILLCFCCHSNQFHKNELLRYQVSKIMSLQVIAAKLYKLKNVLLTELVTYICRYKDKYWI